MSAELIRMNGRSDANGQFVVALDVGVPNADVSVEVRVANRSGRPGEEDSTAPDEWPPDFFERFAGSMPDLRRWPQGNFEDRPSFE
jgi:hypothetical protein